MEQLRIDLASFKAHVDALFKHQEIRQDARHAENRADLSEIRTDVKRINGSVGRHDERLVNQAADIHELRDELDRVAGGMATPSHGISRQQLDDLTTFEESTIKVAQLKWYLAIAGGSIIGMWWVMQLLGFHR